VRSKHVIVRMCCPDGQLREVVAGRGGEEGAKRDLWRFAKTVQWGDVVPLGLSDKPKKVSDDTASEEEQLDER
jgi:ribosomal protein RSM22 (predicted rRNA methylase)